MPAREPLADRARFRDIKAFDIFEGTGNIQRIVIGKRLVAGVKSF
jgi:alkylation response protein AidB-like acyl-CoA dehydrogenase